MSVLGPDFYHAVPGIVGTMIGTGAIIAAKLAERRIRRAEALARSRTASRHVHGAFFVPSGTYAGYRQAAAEQAVPPDESR